MKEHTGEVRIVVKGTPAPWTSPRRGRNGGCIPTPSVNRMKSWQDRVRLAVTKAMREIEELKGPLSLDIQFNMTSGVTTINVGECQFDEPIGHAVKPDLTNLVKSTEDALKGIVFKDDCQVTTVDAGKWKE